MNTTSETLLGMLQQPDNSRAWSKFVELYSPLLFHWVCRSGMQESDAADCVQEVFKVLVVKMPEFQYDRGQSFRNWLRTITLNIWKNHCRQHARRVKSVGDLNDQIGQEDLYTESQYRQEMVERTMELIRPEFQPNTWQAFIEYGVRSRPVDEVAKDLGMSSSAIYVARCRVMGRIRSFLQGMLD